MKIRFKTKIDKQLDTIEYWIDNTSEQILYGGAKGGGKSFLGASLIFGDALIYPETHYFIARQELTDLRKYTIPTIHEVINNYGLKFDDYIKFDGQYNVFTLHNGSKVFLIACKELPSDPMYERFGSMQMTRGWIEEGGEVAERAKANLWLSIGRWKNDVYNLKKKLLITANPKKGWMKSEFVDLARENRLPENIKYIQAFATDNLYLSKDYLNSLRDEKNKVTRQRLWEGNWDYDEEQNSLITYDNLTDTFSNTTVKDGNKYMVIDVARLGKDNTTFLFWNDLELYRIEVFSKQDTQNTIQKAKDFAAIEQIPYSNIMVDEDGIGGAVVDGMFGVKGFIANSRSLPTRNEIRQRFSKIQSDFIPKTNFKNLKSQCAWKLAELINEHKISFKTPEYREKIIEELSALLRQKDMDKDGKLQIIPKEEVKEAIGKSPDIGDPIIYRAWFELKKEATDESDENDQYSRIQNRIFQQNEANYINNSNR